MREEALGWLLPGLGARERDAWQRLVTALRLLRDASRVRESAHALPSWRRARAELASLESLRRSRALETVLRAYLAPLRGPDAFLDLGPPPGAYDRAWRDLLGEAPGPGFPPEPDEDPRRVVARLLALGRARALPAAWVEVWEGVAAHVLEGAVPAERRWQRLLARPGERHLAPQHRARLVHGLVCARLERFQPGAAWALGSAHARLAHLDASLRSALGWSALLAGADEPARRWLADASPGWLPLPLAELREDLPEWAAFLPGAARWGGAPRVGPLDRRALGAQVVAVWARRADGGAEAVHLEGVRGRGAWSRRAEPPLEAPGPLRLRGPALAARAEEPLSGARCRALARLVVRRPSGAPLGWIQLESACLLLPSAPTLVALGEVWRPTLEAWQAGATSRGRRPRAPSPGPAGSAERPRAGDLAAAVEAFRRATPTRAAPSPEPFAWDPAGRLPTRVERMLAHAPERSWTVVGPPGSGRRTLARWIAFRRGARAALAPQAGATALVLCIPPLRERRDEIPALVRAHLAAGGARPGKAARLTDAGLALLWKQDWPGEVASLVAVLACLRRADGGRLDARACAAALEACGLPVRARLPSRPPRLLDLEAALVVTRHANGRPNRARAARYLGWDPGTLAAHLAALCPGRTGSG